MNESRIYDRQNQPVVLLVLLLFAFVIGSITGCTNLRTPTREAILAATNSKDVVGLTEAELRTKYPEMAEIEGSFSIIVSKSLHPYQLPATNKLLRLGREYLVVELKNGRVIALYPVSG
jgi:hypothetical protein